MSSRSAGKKLHGVSRATLDRLLTGKCFDKRGGQTKFMTAEENEFVDLLLSSLEVPLKKYAFRRIIDSMGKSQGTGFFLSYRPAVEKLKFTDLGIVTSCPALLILLSFSPLCRNAGLASTYWIFLAPTKSSLENRSGVRPDPSGGTRAPIQSNWVRLVSAEICRSGPALELHQTRRTETKTHNGPMNIDERPALCSIPRTALPLFAGRKKWKLMLRWREWGKPQLIRLQRSVAHPNPPRLTIPCDKVNCLPPKYLFFLSFAFFLALFFYAHIFRDFFCLL